MFALMNKSVEQHLVAANLLWYVPAKVMLRLKGFICLCLPEQLHVRRLQLIQF